MDIIPKATFSRLGIEAIKGVKPCLVTADGEVIGLWVDPDDIVCLMDLHPRVKTQFKTREQMVRKGMPSPVQLTNKEAAAKLCKEQEEIEGSKGLGAMAAPEPFNVPESQED